MKRDFTHEDFEDFLKRSADSLRMKAPDRVWQNLSKDLGRRRRRLVAGLGLFLLLTTVAGYFIITNTAQNNISASVNPYKQPDAEVQLPVANKGNTKTGYSVTKSKTEPSYVTPPQITANQRVGNGSSWTNTAVALTSPVAEPFVGTATKPPVDPLSPNGVTENNFTSTIVDSYTEFDPQALGDKTENKQDPPARSIGTSLPFTIESVINAFKNRGKTKRLETQLYFTPTISYRKLTENKSYLRSLDPAVAIPANYPGLYTSVNNNVTHKPDLGFELGFTTKYAFSNKVKLRTGIQFNVNRYEIKAFNSTLSPTTIALNSGSRIDSLNTYSRYSNVGGYKSNWLRNLSFQLSVPIGAEYIFAGTDKVKFGIGGSVQPTYLLGDRAYLITTDYKNYTQVPWLVRRWNVNTALETFITYQGAKRTWSIAPQVRYQLLSSFVSEYPVKENLFDFGLKVGISLNK